MRLRSVLILCGLCVAADRSAIHVNHPGLARLKWQLACETDVVRDRSAADAVGVLHGLTVHHLQLSPGAIAADAATLSAALKPVHMDVVSVGPVNADDVDQLQSAFVLAHAVHAKRVVIRHGLSSIDAVAKLAADNHVDAAVLTTGDAVKPAEHVGVAVDLADCRRAGRDPIAALRSAGDRLCVVMIDDVDDAGRSVAFGSGTVNAAAVIDTLKAIRFKGILAVGPDDVAAADRIDRFSASVNAMSTFIGPVPTTVP